jgi:putative ABC transport system permease protein
VTSAQVVSVGIALALLVGISVVAGLVLRLDQWREVLVVVVRAVVQLLAVATVVRFVFTHPALAPVYLVVMVTAATATSSRRLRRRSVRGSVGPAAAAIVAGAALSAAAVLAARAIPWDVRQVLPLVAQLIGGSMTATTLASLRLVDDVQSHWDEVEAWLSLGAEADQAVRPFARGAARSALLPALDQTRNVGLVVLPGAFVGLLLGGASPLQAGRLQLLVLVGLVAAETVAATVVTYGLAGRLGSSRPVPTAA